MLFRSSLDLDNDIDLDGNIDLDSNIDLASNIDFDYTFTLRVRPTVTDYTPGAAIYLERGTSLLDFWNFQTNEFHLQLRITRLVRFTTSKVKCEELPICISFGTLKD